MKRKKKRNKNSLLTFTILSNDANRNATRFRIPRFLLYVLFALPIIPVLALIYYVNVNLNQQAEIDELSGDLTLEVAKSEQLQETVAILENKTGETTERLAELTELEQQMRTYIDELPTMIEPSGGLHIAIEDTETADGLSLLSSEELVDRYKETLAAVDKVSEEVRYTPTAWPTVPNTFTSDFGVRDDPFYQSSAFHSGVDIRGSVGTPVYATADGTVTLARYNGELGNCIRIKHSGTYTTVYGHLNSIDVEVGDVVQKGDIIGTVGSTAEVQGFTLTL